ncbi:MAG: ABC transporter substrate binding protein [Desulfobacteraceae bacterium]|nr:ABC transporter substrate binding protein [Desulfobacteraceae bacterium]
MKISKLTCLIISIVMLALLAGPAAAADLSAKKVVVVSGCAKAVNSAVGYNLVQDGISDTFKAVGITPVFLWADMTYQPDDAAKTKAGDAAIAAAMAEKPDLIITLDDDALKFVGSRIEKIPVVFTWIFGAPNTLGMPKDNVTGIVRASYAVDNWRLAKKLYPNMKTVAMISKPSLVLEGAKKVLAARAPFMEKDSGLLYKDMFMCETFDDWQKAVKEFPYDLMYLGDTSRITKDGKEMDRKELCLWTVDNAKVPVIAAVEVDVEGGALFSIVTSENTTGKMAAETAMGILNGGEISQVYQQTKKGKLVFNVKTAQKYKLEVPYEILSSADRVIEK